MGYTYNFGLVVNNTNTVMMFICESDSSISRAKVSSIATACFNNAIRSGLRIEDAVIAVLDNLKSECKLDARVLRADTVYIMDNKSKGGR